MTSIRSFPSESGAAILSSPVLHVYSILLVYRRAEAELNTIVLPNNQIVRKIPWQIHLENFWPNNPH